MVQFIANLIGNNYIATLIMSIIPLIELKGGIVFARGAGLSFLVAFGLAFAGSTLAFFLVFFLLKPILNWLKKIKFINTFALKIESYFQDKADKMLEKRKANSDGVEKSDSETDNTSYVRRIKQIGTFIFVAIPIPLTGVWTGTAVAVFLNLRFRDAVLPVMLGNLVAGLIVSALAELCLAVWTIKSLDYILYGLFALAVILLVIAIIKISKQKTNKDKESK